MARMLVLYYSSYGHMETMANAIAEGAREAGAEVDVKRVPETAPEEVAKAAHFKLDQAAPVAQIADLEHYDAIVVGTPPASAGSVRRWRPSWTGRAGCGCAAC